MTLIKMGGPNQVVEGDGMFVIGKRKCGVGRMHSKEHVYVCTERGSRKIRRIVVPDKSAAALSVFDKHLLPDTNMHVDDGTENTHFATVPVVTSLTKIPGPIHVDKSNPTLHTQTVESSHSGVKMRLRLGRGLHRHNLQPVMDLEDFIYNRTNGTPADVFKKIGDIAAIYCNTVDLVTPRNSVIPLRLHEDIWVNVPGLTTSIIQSLCSESVYRKAARYEVRSSSLISTQCYPERNTIRGEFRAARIHDQVITWNLLLTHDFDSEPIPFTVGTLAVTCTCRYSKRGLLRTGKLCSHIIGQLRRVLFLKGTFVGAP